MWPGYQLFYHRDTENTEVSRVRSKIEPLAQFFSKQNHIVPMIIDSETAFESL